MKLSMRNLIIIGVAVIMVGIVAVGYLQTNQQKAALPPSGSTYSSPDLMGPGAMGSMTGGADELAQAEIPVAVDAEYEAEVAPLTTDNLPKTILDLGLNQVTSGGPALEAINQLHGTEITVTDGMVVKYGTQGNGLEIWFSTSPTVEEATGLLTAMIEKMQSNEVYSTPVPMPIRKRLYYQTIGHDLMHFFYQRGNQLVWVTLDVPQEKLMSAMKEVVAL